jgi:hypothetical protein
LTPAASAVVVTGKAPLTGDPAAARGAALENARVRAVEETLGVYVSSQVRVEYEVVVQASIYTRAEGLIRNEIILDENRDAYFYYVTIECDVKETDLLAELDKAKISKRRAAFSRGRRRFRRTRPRRWGVVTWRGSWSTAPSPRK